MPMAWEAGVRRASSQRRNRAAAMRPIACHQKGLKAATISGTGSVVSVPGDALGDRVEHRADVGETSLFGVVEANQVDAAAWSTP